MANFDNKVLKKKKLDKELTLKITQNGMSGRIFVEFSAENGKLILQKSFQNTYDGNKEADQFSKSIKSISDLRKYFGINHRPKKAAAVTLVQVGFDSQGMVTKEKKKNVTSNSSGTD